MEKKAPTHLQHKPIISISDYAKKDAQFQKETDACALSIGTAQYDDSEISLKVWRHTGERWSPQSEELPIHRCIDLNILFLDALFYSVDKKHFISDGKINEPYNVENIKKYYEENKLHLKPRLIELNKKLMAFLEK